MSQERKRAAVAAALADIEPSSSPIRQVPADPHSQAAFFDIDETLVRGASFYQVVRELYRHGFFGISDMFFAARKAAFYMVAGERPEHINQIVERALSRLEGHSLAEMLTIGRDVSNMLVDHRIFPGTKQILDRHLEYGHQVWLVSATPIQIAQVLAERLGATGAIATRVALVDGRFEPRLVGGIVHGQGKADAVRELAEREGIDLAESWAYSDSISDQPLLEMVGNPHVINPDVRLRLLSISKGWPVHDFRRLRRRSLRQNAHLSAEIAGYVWVVTRMLRYLRRRLWR
ncbi:MAG: HAD family hydrolase [Varibaculum sp.]|nr:HAD family hydrolase [Varibaculum sp.]